MSVFCYSVYLSTDWSFLQQGHSYQQYLRSQHKPGRKHLQSHCCTCFFSSLQGLSPKSQPLSPIPKAIRLRLHLFIPCAFNKMGAPDVEWLGGDKSSRLTEASLSVAMAFEAQTRNCHGWSPGLECSVQRGWLEMSLSGCALWFLSWTTCWMVLRGWVRVMYWVSSLCRSLCGVGWMEQDITGQKTPTTPTRRLLKIPQRAS